MVECALSNNVVKLSIGAGSTSLAVRRHMIMHRNFCEYERSFTVLELTVQDHQLLKPCEKI